MIQTKADYIHDRIAEGEHQQQDFKFEISDARKIAKSLSAFSNTDGGRLLVGVKDNGKIAGVRSEEEMYMIEAAAKLYCKPQIDCEMHVHTVEGRTVLEVPPGKQNPITPKITITAGGLTSGFWMKTYLPPPCISKYGNKPEPPKEHSCITRKQNRFYWITFFHTTPSH